MQPFSLTFCYYAFTLGIGLMYLWVTLDCRPPAWCLRAPRRQVSGDRLFWSFSILIWAGAWLLYNLLPANPVPPTDESILLANYLLMTGHLLAAAVFIQARRASLTVHYLFFSGAILVMALAGSRMALPSMEDDRWLRWSLFWAGAGSYRMFLKLSGRMPAATVQHTTDHTSAPPSSCHPNEDPV